PGHHIGIAAEECSRRNGARNAERLPRLVSEDVVKRPSADDAVHPPVGAAKKLLPLPYRQLIDSRSVKNVSTVRRAQLIILAYTVSGKPFRAIERQRAAEYDLVGQATAVGI